MRISRILASLVLIGGAIAQGQNGPPIFAVSHDSTLKGAGTTASPLGVANSGISTPQIANGAVTAPKLNITGTPATGKVIGFDGAGLTWQTPSAGAGSGARVVDSAGHSYPLVFQDAVTTSALWRWSGKTFLVPLTAPGIVNRGWILFTSADCSGPAYVQDLISQGYDFPNYPNEVLIISYPLTTILGSTLYYPAGPLVNGGVGFFHSYKSNASNGTTATGVSGCMGLIGDESIPARVASTVDLSTEFVPPFSVALN